MRGSARDGRLSVHMRGNRAGQPGQRGTASQSGSGTFPEKNVYNIQKSPYWDNPILGTIVYDPAGISAGYLFWF